MAFGGWGHLRGLGDAGVMPGRGSVACRCPGAIAIQRNVAGMAGLVYVPDRLFERDTLRHEAMLRRGTALR
jgi:hypothetical protein